MSGTSAQHPTHEDAGDPLPDPRLDPNFMAEIQRAAIANAVTTQTWRAISPEFKFPRTDALWNAVNANVLTNAISPEAAKILVKNPEAASEFRNYTARAKFALDAVESVLKNSKTHSTANEPQEEPRDKISEDFTVADVMTVASILGFSEPTPSQLNVLAEELAELRERMVSKLEWERLAGPIIEPGEVLRLTGWTRQSLSKAVKQHRVLRLIGSNGRTTYPRDLFTGKPARPLEGIKPVLEAWKDVDGWSVLAWLVSENPDLESRTPREVLEHGSGSDREKVAVLAVEAAGRMMQ